MHRRHGRSKERFAVFATGRNDMMRILGALLAAALSLLVMVCMGFAGAYQFLAQEIPAAATLRIRVAISVVRTTRPSRRGAS